MIDGRRILGVIPARGGSRGLPGKNIASLGGRPLISWTIAAAGGADLIDRCIVSTDDPEIANAARESGGEVPFMRPADLAADDTPGVDPILHACDQIDGYDIVVMLQPTSPLRRSSDIDGAIRHMVGGGYRTCVSVVDTKHHPNWLVRVEDDGRLRRYDNKPLIPRRQDLPPIYALNGAVYAADVATLRRERTFLTNDTGAYVMPPDRSFDIDSVSDLRCCEAMLDGNVIDPEAG